MLKSGLLRAFAVVTLTIAVAVPAASRGQEPRSLIIRAGVLIDGSGNPPRKDMAIVVQEGRIAEVRSATPADRSDTTSVDLSGHYVLPGLIDVHAHLTMSHDPVLDYGGLSAASTGILGVVHARRTLMAGFTTVRDPFGPYFADVALRDAIEAGWIEGPRMFVSGPGLTMTGGHAAVGNWAPPGLDIQSAAVSVVDGTDEIRREVRRHQKYGVDFIKIIATGGIFTTRSDPAAAAFTRDEIEAAVDEARKRGQRVAAHAHGTEGIRNAVLAGVHSIEHGSFLDAPTAKLMAERGTFLVSDVYADEYSLTHGEQLGHDAAQLESARKVSGQFRKSLQLARAAGVKIAFGTDAGVFPHGDNARQFALYGALGLSPMEAILTATRDAADLLGANGQLGTIEAGKYADIIAVRGNPLDDIRQLESVRFVMKGGRIVKQPNDR